MALVQKRDVDAQISHAKRARVRISLEEAVCNAAEQLSYHAMLECKVPHYLYAFVPLINLRDPPQTTVAQGRNVDDESPMVSNDDKDNIENDEPPVAGEDDEDNSEDDEPLVAGEDDEDNSEDDGLVDDDEAVPEEEEAVLAAAGGAMPDEEQVSDDDDYASDWDGDSDADDSDDDEDSDDDDGKNDNDDDDIVDLGQGLYVDATHVPTLYTSEAIALTAALRAHRSRRMPLEGVLLKYRQYKDALELRIGEAMYTQLGQFKMADDADDSEAVTNFNGHAANGNDAVDTDDEDDNTDEDEDRPCVPDPPDTIVAGRVPEQPYPCQRAMIFYVRRYAEGNPACTEGEFAAMYADCPKGHNGWVDVDRSGISCVRMHWDTVNEMMVRAGMTIVDENVVRHHLDTTPIDPVSGEPQVTDADKLAVLRALGND